MTMRFVMCVVVALGAVGCGGTGETAGGGGTTTTAASGGTTSTPPPLDTSPGTPSTTLDGRTFAGPMTQPGSSEPARPETIIFEGGTFESVGCRQYGFTPATYSTRADGAAVVFHSVATSPAEGMMVWDGRITGGHVSLRSVWRKAGQADIAYALEGEVEAAAAGGTSVNGAPS